MRAIFGVVSLLVALAVVGLVVVKQMKAVASAGPSPTTARADAGAVATPQVAGSGTVREQSRALQDKVATDVTKALEQGSARTQEADK